MPKTIGVIQVKGEAGGTCIEGESACIPLPGNLEFESHDGYWTAPIQCTCLPSYISTNGMKMGERREILLGSNPVVADFANPPLSIDKAVSTNMVQAIGKSSFVQMYKHKHLLKMHQGKTF